MRIGIARVHGRSMRPRLRERDRLLVTYDMSPRVGDVVVARLPDGTVALKRIELIDVRGVWLASDNAAEGWNSRAWDQPVPANDVQAIARARIWPWPRLLRRFTP